MIPLNETTLIKQMTPVEEKGPANDSKQPNNLNFWIFQIAGWTPFFFLQIAGFGGDSLWDPFALIYAFSVSLLAMTSSVFLRRLFKKYNGLKTRAVIWVCLVITACLVAAMLVDFAHHGIWYLSAMYVGSVEIIYSAQPLFAVTVFLFPTYLAWSVLYFVITKQEALKNAIIERQQLEIELKEYQLSSLLKQLNPHFMFNTINNIRALILKDHDKARDMLASFADIMRYQININNISLVTVREELDFVREYMTLCKLHLGKRLRYEESIDSDLLLQKIPRMAIQLLMENAIKHGISQSATPGCLSLSINYKDVNSKASGSKETNYEEHQSEQWFIKVTNPGVINQTQSNSGVGLANLKERFTLSYQDRAEITLTQVKDTVESTIIINRI